MLFRCGGGTSDHVINTDTTEGDRNRSFGFGQRGSDDFIYQRGVGLQRIDLVHSGCCPQDIVSRNAIAFPSELVAAMRAPNSPQDAIAHQCLQHRLEVSRWQPVAGGQCLSRHRARAGIYCNVDDRSNCQDALSGHQSHFTNHSW
jgi:hypothetical protein